MKDIDRKIQLALWLSKHNNGLITGSLMLYLRGIKLERDIHDIDIIVSDLNSLVLPPFAKRIENDYSFNEMVKYEFMGIKIDFFKDDIKYEYTTMKYDNYDDTFKLAPIKQLYLAKSKYLFSETNSNEYLIKTINDLNFLNNFLLKQKIFYHFNK